MLEHVTFITLKPHDHERIDAREFGLLDDYSKLVCLVLSPNCLLAAPLAPAALGMPALSVRKLVSAEPRSALATRTASTFDGSDSESHGGAAVAQDVVDICFHLFFTRSSCVFHSFTCLFTIALAPHCNFIRKVTTPAALTMSLMRMVALVMKTMMLLAL